MKRITWKKDGKWGINGINWDKVPNELYGALCKLKDYEDTELSPDEVNKLKKDAHDK